MIPRPAGDSLKANPFLLHTGDFALAAGTAAAACLSTSSPNGRCGRQVVG